MTHQSFFPTFDNFDKFYPDSWHGLAALIYVVFSRIFVAALFSVGNTVCTLQLSRHVKLPGNILQKVLQNYDLFWKEKIPRWRSFWLFLNSLYKLKTPYKSWSWFQSCWCFCISCSIICTKLRRPWMKPKSGPSWTTWSRRPRWVEWAKSIIRISYLGAVPDPRWRLQSPS